LNTLINKESTDKWPKDPLHPLTSFFQIMASFVFTQKNIFKKKHRDY